jgi:hypothetical protein
MAFTLTSKILLFALSCFTPKHDELTFTEAKIQLINQYKLHSADQDLGVKNASFEISENGFIRYKRTTSDNKSEYYSVKLDQFKDAFYLGDEKAGWLLLKFTDEAVIYQTYNDKTGNVDEMLTEIKIPLKNIDVNDINSLYEAMKTLKQSGI